MPYDWVWWGLRGLISAIWLGLVGSERPDKCHMTGFGSMARDGWELFSHGHPPQLNSVGFGVVWVTGLFSPWWIVNITTTKQSTMYLCTYFMWLIVRTLLISMHFHSAKTMVLRPYQPLKACIFDNGVSSVKNNLKSLKAKVIVKETYPDTTSIDYCACWWPGTIRSHSNIHRHRDTQGSTYINNLHLVTLRVNINQLYQEDL